MRRLRTKYDNAVSRAIDGAGFKSIIAFARAHGLRQQYVQRWVTKGYVPNKYCPLFCGATGAKRLQVARARTA